MHHSFALVRALRPSAAATTGRELHVNRRPVRAPPPFQCLPRKRACAPGGLRPTAERTAWARVRSAPRTAYRGRVWVVLNALGASAIPFARSQSSRFGASCLLRIPRQRGPKRFRRLESSLFAEVVSGRRLWWLRPSADALLGKASRGSGSVRGDSHDSSVKVERAFADPEEGVTANDRRGAW
jgi:hypothetical protein